MMAWTRPPWRGEACAGLEKLAAEGQRVVVTSRPLGYERLAGLEHFQVLPLLPQDAEAFTDRWFRALAQARGVPEAEQEGWATERASWLKRQLEERPGLREVARNPLLLTFLAVLAGDEPQRDLPRRRKELYREYVERLFTVWEARRRREGELSLGRLRGEEARRVALRGLYRTAWHLHRAYYGDDEELRAVCEEIEPLLARDLRERWEFGALQAEALAAELLRFWEGAGLLDVYRLAGQEWLTFHHLTFQECGAARELAKMYGNDADGLWQSVEEHLLSPQWAIVIPLALAHLSEPQATTLVDRLLDRNEGDDERHRPLFLAATALAEGAKIADAPHQWIVDALLNLAWMSRWSPPRAWEYRRTEDALAALGRLVEDGYAAAGLLALARDWTVDDLTRVGAAEALGRLGRTNQAEQILLTLAQRSDVGVRVEAVEALGRLGRMDQAAELLLNLGQDGMVEPEAREWAAEALCRLGRTAEGAELLLSLACDISVDKLVREEAAAALERLVQVDVLLALGRDPGGDAWVRGKAAWILQRMGQVDKGADAWLALALDCAVEVEVREWAVESLEESGWASPTVLAGLRALTVYPGTPESVRQAAREALRRLKG